jgi:hypothetical protein
MDGRVRADRIEAKVLRFLGEFSSLQASIDAAIAAYLADRMPAVGPLICENHVERLRDEDRIPLLLAMAADTGYSGDLSEAKARFVRAKETRDLIGHSQSVEHAYDPAADDWIVAVSRRATYPSRRLNRVPHPLYPGTLDRLSNDCSWLAQHAWRIAYGAGVLGQVVDPTGRSVEFPPIPKFPVDGEPL